MRRKLLLVIGAWLMWGGILFAQNGDKYFDNKDYRAAVLAYEREVDKEPEKYLKLAKCHIALQQFDQAAEALQHYIDGSNGADKEYARNLLELVQRNDDPVRITNLGSGLNLEGSEYLPVVTADGQRLYFCADGRAGGLGGEDIWYSDKLEDGSWSTPQNFKSLNTASHEALMSISADGNVAILFGNYNGSFGNGDLFYSVKTANGWSVPCNLGGDVNSNSWESQANLSADGKTLIFTSNKEGTYGNGDLWVTQLGDNGWSKPINLGSTINTSASEGSPQLAADGKTLYYKSAGLPGFGGYDVFMAKRLDDSWQNWSKPRNLGKYINTLEDDEYLALPSSGIKAYVNKSNLADGYGGSDLYEFIMPLDMRPEATVNVYGAITDEKSQKVSAIIRYYDFATDKEVAQTQSNPENGVYKTSLPLYKKYRVVIDMRGYLYHTSLLDLSDPENLWGKEYINAVLGSPRLKKLNELQQTMEKLNDEIKQLLASNASDIKETFDKYQQAIAEYNTALNDFENNIYDAKYSWMGREDVRTDLKRDYSLQSVTVGASFELKNIFFDFGKASLKDESKEELDKLYDIMNRSRIVIELGGHTDSIGSDEANLRLSQERVNSVRSYLVSKGIDAVRISAVGYGETMPIADNKTEEGRAKNRRVEAKITEIMREGKDVAGTYTEVVEEESDFDVLSALQRAARKGGVPEGSYCSDEVLLTSEVDYKDYTNIKDNNNNGFNPLGRGDYFDRKDYIYGGFNISAINFGFKNPNWEFTPNNTERFDFWGVELNRVKQNYKEGRWRLYGKGSQGTGLGFGNSMLWDIRLHKLTSLNLNLHFGYDLDVFGVIADNTNELKAKGFFNIPVGLRYVHQLGALKIGPELFYSYGLFQPDNWPKSTYLRLGTSLRWKVFQGGIFINKGAEISYLGLRAGLAF
ncbi:OmpA family protein [bacterium]|nr:OmpA family protein [bacterium]